MYKHREDDVLAEAIGRYTLSTLDNVVAVYVTYDAHRRHAQICLGLEDTSFDAQTEVFSKVHELEEHYEDDGITLGFLPYPSDSALFTDPEHAQPAGTASKLLTA